LAYLAFRKQSRAIRAIEKQVADQQEVTRQHGELLKLQSGQPDLQRQQFDQQAAERRRLEPDPATAPVVRWMFAQRLAGHSLARITRALNDAGVPCPSAADPKRNPHRAGTAWTLRTVAAIPANPRYTGRQVWNRQRTDLHLVDSARAAMRDTSACEAAHWEGPEWSREGNGRRPPSGPAHRPGPGTGGHDLLGACPSPRRSSGLPGVRGGT
jgi:hypothetical protein